MNCQFLTFLLSVYTVCLQNFPNLQSLQGSVNVSVMSLDTESLLHLIFASLGSQALSSAVGPQRVEGNAAMQLTS